MLAFNEVHQCHELHVRSTGFNRLLNVAAHQSNLSCFLSSSSFDLLKWKTHHQWCLVSFFFVSELLQAAIIKLLRWLFSLLWTIDYRLPINSKWIIPSGYTLWDTSYSINSYWYQVTTIIITPLQTITALIEIISINPLSIHEPKHFSVQFHRPGMYNMIDDTNVVGFFVGFLAGWDKDMCI